MKISFKKYAIALYEATDGLKGRELDVAVKRFVDLLAKRGLIGRADKIIHEYEKYRRGQQGILSVKISTAQALSVEEEKNIKRRLGTAWDKEIELTTKVDPTLIGGAVLETDNLLLDGSVRRHLEQLRQKLVL